MAVAELLLDRGANINQVMVSGRTPLSSSCEKGHLVISELLIASNKFDGYTPEQFKKIIRSCRAYFQADTESAMSYCIIAYQCYKHLDDPNYTFDAQEQSTIDRGKAEEVRQKKLLMSLFVSQTKNYPESCLQGDLWEKMSTYLPTDWLGR